MKVIGFMVYFLKIIELWDLSIEFYDEWGALVLMEAGSTMKLKQISIKVCTGPPQVNVILASCSSILQFPVQHKLSVKVLGSPTVYAPMDK